MEFMLPGTAAPVDIGSGYRITAPDVAGRGEHHDAASTPGTRALGADPFDAMLEAAGLRRARVVTLHPVPTAPRNGRGARGARALGDVPTVTLDVPHAPDEAALLLVEDEAGALRWVKPERDAGAARALGDGGGAASRFTVPVGRAAGASAAAGARGLSLGGLGTKVLKVFLYPITDALLGPVIRGFARKWEEHSRPYLARPYGPDDYKTDRPDVPALDADGWRRLAGGRALLWVHGTFSSCGAFAAVAPEAMRELVARYDGRSFAFNHYTLSDDPLANARALLAMIPDDVRLDVDVVCHSRGGLVARELAALGRERGARLRVGRVVMVGVPNAGTALADDDHMVEMIDRLTTVTKLIPAGTAQLVVDGLVTAIKVIGHGFLHDLVGLRAMNPRDRFLADLNVDGDAPELYAIASDFEPAPGTPWFSLTRAADGALDRVFSGEPNDLVVPRDGVSVADGAGGFPVGDDRTFRFAPADAVIHTEYFAQARTHDQLLAWLTGADVARDLGARPRAASRPALAPEELLALRPHVVDLSEGTFRRSGSYATEPGDVDAIFAEHLPKWAAALPAGEPLRVVLYAHGGLVGERDGLDVARKHVAWWKRNGVYPIYFVWETGLFDAIGSILESVRARVPGLGARDLADYTTDPLVETGARALGGVKIWGAMKQNAALCSAPGAGAADAPMPNEGEGGAHYLARRLAAFARTAKPALGRDLELHAVGHSAGAIFHAHFIPAATALGAPAFTTTQLLAPAVRVDEFERRLLPAVGNAAGRLTMYTMRRDLERADRCTAAYHKSLLYLITKALEPERDEPILGLEDAIRASRPLTRLLGLDGRGESSGTVVWSVTDAAAGNAASRSTSHGGFDDDAATMGSVAARVLGADAARVPYTGAARALGNEWPTSSEWAADVADDVPTPGIAAKAPGAAHAAHAPPAANPQAPARTTPARTRPVPATGERRALCIGINAYPAPDTLEGCVADATAWGGLFDDLGFDVERLVDRDATYDAITGRLRALVHASRPGDVLFVQYSGHGTLVPDYDGDEGDGGQDSALVPVDFGGGRFLVDDDVRAILSELREGVHCTVFVDCCHSGTITRMLGDRLPPGEPGAKARFIELTEEDLRRYDAFHRSRAGAAARALAASRAVGRDALRWVNFSACDTHEVAYENGGHGDFTRLALEVIARAGTLTNGAFQQAVVASFGDGRRQNPVLDCAEGDEALPLLPFAPGGGTPASDRDDRGSSGSRGVRDGAYSYRGPRRNGSAARRDGGDDR